MPSESGSRGRLPPPPPPPPVEETGEEAAAREVLAPPVVQVSSSSSGEEAGEEESGGSDEEARGGSGNRGARVSESGDRAAATAASGGEAEWPYLPSCPICMNVWTADGAHRVSCLPCGHVYGRSCLERWLLQCGKKNATCPQCGRRYKQKNIITLYVPEIAVPNNDLEKQVLSLREKNESLEKQSHPEHQAPQEQDAVLTVLTHLQSSIDRLDAEYDQRHAESNQRHAEIKAMIEDLNMRVTHMDERLTEYQQQRVPLAYQMFGRGQRPPSASQRGDHPSQSEAPSS